MPPNRCKRRYKGTDRNNREDIKTSISLKMLKSYINKSNKYKPSNKQSQVLHEALSAAAFKILAKVVIVSLSLGNRAELNKANSYRRQNNSCFNQSYSYKSVVRPTRLRQLSTVLGQVKEKTKDLNWKCAVNAARDVRFREHASNS